MHIENFRAYCLKKKGASEDFPFDTETLVFKVKGKMFALTNVDFFESINLKCDPELAVELREKYHAVIPGYHMNKKHWNTVNIDGTLSDQLIREWIDHSYNQVVQKLPAKLRQEI
jgi:predicted DNA-binding protein (MmcQ/YjbR family)